MATAHIAIIFSAFKPHILNMYRNVLNFSNLAYILLLVQANISKIWHYYIVYNEYQ